MYWLTAAGSGMSRVLPPLTGTLRKPQLRSRTPPRFQPTTTPARSTGYLVLGLLLRNYLLYFTSCLTETRLVTEFVTREALRLARSAQVEAGDPEVGLPGGSTQRSAPGLTGVTRRLLALRGPGPLRRQMDGE